MDTQLRLGESPCCASPSLVVESHAVYFEYDATGALSVEQTSIGDTTYYHYDAAGRRSEFSGYHTQLLTSASGGL